MARLLARLVAINDRWASRSATSTAAGSRRCSGRSGRSGPAPRSVARPSAPLGHHGHPDRPAPRRSSWMSSVSARRPTSPSWRRSSSWSCPPVSGLADYTTTDGTALTRATLHATLMTVALVVLIVSLVLRAGAPGRPDAADRPRDRRVPARHRRRVRRRRRRLRFREHGQPPCLPRSRDEVGPSSTPASSTDLADLPEAHADQGARGDQRPGPGPAARRSTPCHVCAHAGGPLDEGTVVDGCLQCPWHCSRFRLTDGRARRGPSVYDQPAYEVRAAEGGGYEVRRAES